MTRAAAPSADAASHPSGPTEIGWLRAALSAVAIVAIGFLGAVYVPDALVGSLSGLSTQTRSLIAAGVSIGSVVLVAAALRALQARRRI